MTCQVAEINRIAARAAFLQKWDDSPGMAMPNSLLLIFGLVGVLGALLLLVLMRRRQPKLNVGSDSERALWTAGLGTRLLLRSFKALKRAPRGVALPLPPLRNSWELHGRRRIFAPPPGRSPGIARNA